MRSVSAASFLWISACGPATGVALPFLDAPPAIELDLQPIGVPIPVQVQVLNLGTADADVLVDRPSSVAGPASVTVPAGGGVLLDLQVTLATELAVRVPVSLSAGPSRVVVELRARGLADVDGDGFAGQAAGGPDCDDADPAIHPDAIERCDGRDEDCDGTVDDVATAVIWFADHDDDGWGLASAPIAGGCLRPPAAAADPGDCDDQDGSVHPSAPELDDGADQDCDGLPDEDFVVRGDLVITELHGQPTAPGAAYLELAAIGARGIALDQLTLDGVPLAGGVPPGGLALICDDDGLPAGLVCASMAPLDGPSMLRHGAVLLDEIEVGPVTTGVARELDPTSWHPDTNDDPAAWCDARALAPSGDLGSPNQPNDPCP